MGIHKNIEVRKGNKRLIDQHIDISIPMFENCPRFSFCDYNKCPLHPDFNKLVTSKEDKSRKCLLGKTRRKRILKYYPIKKQEEADRTKGKEIETPKNKASDGGKRA